MQESKRIVMAIQDKNEDTGGNTHERHTWAILPDQHGVFMLCPELLTEEEAIRYLRLDINGPKNPSGTLKYYRDQGVLRAVRIGRKLRYPRIELDCMIQRLLHREGDR